MPHARDLTYPGAWSVGGMVEALAAGLDARGLHRVAATHFAIGKGKAPGSMGRAFSYRDIAVHLRGATSTRAILAQLTCKAPACVSDPSAVAPFR